MVCYNLCIESNGLDEIWDTWSQRSNKYVKEENYRRFWKTIIPKVDLNKLVNLLHEEEIDDTVELISALNQ